MEFLSSLLFEKSTTVIVIIISVTFYLELAQKESFGVTGSQIEQGFVYLRHLLNSPV
jgi:hypothetical protein